ncbi:MAG TPA: hypothetical protein VHW01_05405 [Polyangiaceae bacterium]|jgi:hypothetical protein|nr:hypothetical protein [Polyangiaceae bacterium]
MTRRDSDPGLPALAAEEERRLATLLKCAFAPSEIDPVRHEHLLLSALEDPFAAPSPEEIVESERLRRALDGDGDHLDLVLARALSAAHAPSEAAPKVVAPATLAPKSRPTAKVLYVRFAGAAAALAAAAAVLFTISTRHCSPEASAPELPALALVQSRSTAALFQTASVGPPSARIDRIASVRERDLRANRYAMWGVR